MTSKKKGSRIAVILPTYCEEENISNLISTIEGLGMNSSIVVIDDSSPDRTQEVVKSLDQRYHNITLLVRPSKMGLGTAITHGFRHLISLPYPPEYVITMDADYSHNPRDIPKLLQQGQMGYDLVIGSRYGKEGKVEGWKLDRLLISKVANKLTGALIKLPISDFTSGFRCYSREYIRRALPALHSPTYEIQIETIRQAKLQNSRVSEVPIVFENRKRGKSKLTINEIVTFSRYILKVLWEQTFLREK
ncbi:MAG TPA: polyprenol monophosphomannose synthase [Candidatus Bathyarchaeia archaeon]|nr:polyprenol monophosphomannose synthase [Candidatus Bathyarchaeia archaeon]